MLISEFISVGWVLCSLISVSSLVFWFLWPGFLAASMTSDPVGRMNLEKLTWPLVQPGFSAQVVRM